MRVDKQVTSKVFRQVHRAGSVPAALMGGAAALTLPTGAVGAWYASNYQATPRRVIPNSASSTAENCGLSTNLLVDIVSD